LREAVVPGVSGQAGRVAWWPEVAGQSISSLVTHARLKLLTSNLVVLAKCTPMSAAQDINIPANDASKSLAAIADIVPHPTTGEERHDELRIDRNGRGFAVGRNASDGKAAS
jgi:hypothetical protein